MNANIKIGIKGEFVVLKLGNVISVLMSPKHALVIASSLMEKAVRLMDGTDED